MYHSHMLKRSGENEIEGDIGLTGPSLQGWQMSLQNRYATQKKGMHREHSGKDWSMSSANAETLNREFEVRETTNSLCKLPRLTEHMDCQQTFHRRPCCSNTYLCESID